MNQSPPSERSPFGPDADRKILAHLAEHRDGQHGRRVDACPSCLFRGATWPDLSDDRERMAP